MRNKILIVVFLLMASVSAWADSFTFGNLKYAVIDSANHYVSVGQGETKPEGDLVIPAEVENGGIKYTVTAIYGYSFSSCSELTSVTIPEVVTVIHELAFLHCNKLTEINVASDNSKYSSQDGVLFNKDKTTLVFCPKGKVGTYIIPNSVRTIDPSAFEDCKNLNTVVIGDSVKSIGSYAFRNCYNLTSVVIGDSVKKIGWNAFGDCNGLTKVEYSSIESLLEIKYDNECANPIYYAKCLYINGKEVTELIIPNTIKSINDYAFNKCQSLTSVVIGDSVKSIGSYAFADCYNLTSVVIGDSVKSIGRNAFSYCYNLPSVVIGDSVKSIGEEAFYYCYNFKTVVIPDSVSTIGKSAFYRAKNIVYSGNAKGGPWGALTLNGIIDGDFVYSDAGKTNLTAYIGDGGDVVIPDAVINIGICAFYDCPNLKSVTIPNSVTSIGGYAFFCCSGLTSIHIPNSVTGIGRYVFAYCSGLTSVTIPNSVTSIGDYVFEGCTTTIYCDFERKPEGWDWHWKGDEYEGEVIWKTATPATETAANAVSIYACGNTIVVENAAEEISVYDAMGRMIGRDAINRVRTEIRVNNPGLYIVKVGNVAKRVVVR